MSFWENSDVFKFIDLYKSEECIWNPRSNAHKDKVKVNDAWNRISESIGFSVPALKKKKESLMTTFRGHLKKKKASMRSGSSSEDIYEPIWVFYDALESFLGDVYECSSVFDTTNIGDFTTIDDSTGEAQVCLPRSAKKYSVSQKRETNPSEWEDTNRHLKNACTSFNAVLNKQKEEDESEIFGKFIGAKLKKMPQQIRNEVMFKMHKLIINSTTEEETETPQNQTSAYAIPRKDFVRSSIIEQAIFNADLQEQINY